MGAPYYIQAAFGMTRSYLSSVNFESLAQNQEYDVMIYYGRCYIDLRISCMRFRNQKGTLHGGRHAATFLTGELCIQERDAFCSSSSLVKTMPPVGYSLFICC